jgi:hypothetical protein
MTNTRIVYHGREDRGPHPRCNGKGCWFCNETGRDIIHLGMVVEEKDYPLPLVTSRYLIDKAVDGVGTHVVVIKDQVTKVGDWESCCLWAEDLLKNRSIGALPNK